MTWLDFYWVCLIVGLSLAILTLLFGTLHVPASGHGHDLSASGHGGVHGHGHHGGHHHAGAADSPRISAANFTVLMVFLAWFGGAGALIRGETSFGPVVAFVAAVSAGVVGARLILLFANRVLAAHDHSMKPTDYALPGMLATVTMAIREEGCGEITYVQGGTRKSAAARSEDGSPISNGTEVVVSCFLEGIAYVRPWNETAGDNETLS
jgi:membrane protein implicated in regulation of membrane protease activity